MFRQKPTCPNCNSKKIIQKGLKKSKFEIKQRYYCKNCKILFIEKSLKNKTYPSNLILTSLSLYNLGYSQTKIIKIIAKKFKINPSQKTISNWINEYKPMLPFHKLRKKAIKLYNPEEIIETYTLLHNNLPYKFQIHKVKSNLAFQNTKFNNHSRFLPIKQYLEKIPTKEFPHHIFKPQHNIENEIKQRASQFKFSHLKITKLSKNNLANKLTELALNLAKTNKQRHQEVQNFMLINDSTTIATEVPIYLTNDDLIYFLSKNFSINLQEYKTPLTGHIDILQIRNNLIHILDYKPEANKINPINQLTVYAIALASRTKLALKDFKCAWFDNKNYYEFFPLHAVYKIRKI